MPSMFNKVTFQHKQKMVSTKLMGNQASKPINPAEKQGFWRKLPPTFIRQFAPIQTDSYTFTQYQQQPYYFTFPSVVSGNYDYLPNYHQPADEKRKRHKRRESKRKNPLPVGVTVRYRPPQMTIAQMVSNLFYTFMTLFHSCDISLSNTYRHKPIGSMKT